MNRVAAPTRSAYKKSWLGVINAILFTACIALVITQTILTNTQVAQGGQTNQLQQTKQQLSNQVSQIKKDISSYTSLQRIKPYAETTLHMQPLQANILYLPTPTIPPTP